MDDFFPSFWQDVPDVYNITKVKEIHESCFMLKAPIKGTSYISYSGAGGQGNAIHSSYIIR